MARLTETYEEYVSRFPEKYRGKQKSYSFESGIIYERLGAYEDAEEQGLLERLKVNVGDIVWIITKPANFSLGIWREITLSMAEQRKVKLITLTKDEVQYHTKERMYCEKDFGEKVFLTKEEAEQALAKMKEV